MINVQKSGKMGDYTYDQVGPLTYDQAGGYTYDEPFIQLTNVSKNSATPSNVSKNSATPSNLGKS